MERRLRLSDQNRQLLLEALTLYFEAEAEKKRYHAASNALQLAHAIHRNTTGRRGSLLLSTSKEQWRSDLKQLKKWTAETCGHAQPEQKKDLTPRLSLEEAKQRIATLREETT